MTYAVLNIDIFFTFSHQVKTVVFDKTGTLTSGKPQVTRAILYVSESVCSFQLFTVFVGVAESNSEHPLGVAITKYAESVCACDQ